MCSVRSYGNIEPHTETRDCDPLASLHFWNCDAPDFHGCVVFDYLQRFTAGEYKCIHEYTNATISNTIQHDNDIDPNHNPEFE